jgi:hypothetical protein
MAMTFDATLKHMGRDAPLGFLTAFDQLPTVPVKPLNVDLSTVTTAGDLILGLGDPPAEFVHTEFQVPPRINAPTCSPITRCSSRTAMCRCTRSFSCFDLPRTTPI